MFYVIDPDLRLLWVGGDWDDFALENDGRSIRAAQVLGTDLAPYIAGPATLTALRLIIAAVHDTKRTFRMEYRCDSPVQRRDVRLTVTPLSGDRLMLTHDLRDAQLFPPLGPGWTWNPAAPARKCSFCCALRQPDGSWADPFSLGTPHPEQVDYAVCPTCQSTIEAEIRRIRKAGRPA